MSSGTAPEDPADFQFVAASDDDDIVAGATPATMERQRIESYNRRTGIALRAVAASDEADKRQYAVQMARLACEESTLKQRDKLARLLIWAIGGGGAGVLCFI